MLHGLSWLPVGVKEETPSLTPALTELLFWCIVGPGKTAGFLSGWATAGASQGGFWTLVHCFTESWLASVSISRSQIWIFTLVSAEWLSASHSTCIRISFYTLRGCLLIWKASSFAGHVLASRAGVALSVLHSPPPFFLFLIFHCLFIF